MAPLDAALHRTRENRSRALRESPGVDSNPSYLHSVYFEAADAGFVTPRDGSASESGNQEGFCLEKWRGLSRLAPLLSSLPLFD